MYDITTCTCIVIVYTCSFYLNVPLIYFLDPSIDLENLNMCINAVSGVMKAFFKLLPDPLIPESLLPALLDIPGT